MDQYFKLYTKTNSRWIIDLNVSAKTVQVLEPNIRKKLGDLVLDRGFLDVTPKAQSIKKKELDKLDFIKMKNSCSSKDTVGT